MTFDLEQGGRILQDCARELSGDVTSPIRLRPICREFGVVSICRAALENGPALLIDADTRPKILLKETTVKPHHPKMPFTPRERFLIAHELGHLILRRAKMPLPSGVEQYWKTELLCDSFARELLVPEKIVQQLIQKNSDNAVELLRLTHRVAAIFRVPWLTAASRLSDLRQCTVFFKFVESTKGGLKVSSTSLHNKGVCRRIAPDTTLYKNLFCLRANKRSVELLPSDISGLFKQTIIQGVAGCAAKKDIRLAVCTA